ncbi:SrfA family protein [Citrobacter braakii]|uniref:SrfA family protein n=1 Tax=Citrobacter braakii TaxID=57706 RepID=UPI002DBB60DB|nr:SrfA family protein [Citrobacter braakii]MEC3927276.1 SrfA family protein [Citrobacter braakii]
MRNSIQGPLLRTGHNSSFKALGETGYPVFKMAFQLREAIYRLDAGRDLARHLAIPQNDQGGDRTDWYSSFPGDVIPWSGASEAERESARQQFNAFQMSVQALSEQLLNAEQNRTGGDRRVFAQLLKSVTHFPDYEFVYLVNGILVITFWGFVHPEGETT